MYIAEINEQFIWDKFVAELGLNTFLHTSGWVGFNQKQGSKLWKLGIFEAEKLVSVALVLKIEAKRGKFLFCPHGPQSIYTQKFDSIRALELETLTDYLKDLAKRERCTFIRIQPIIPKTEDNADVFKQAGYRAAPIHMHTELTTVLDLQRSTDKILLGMRKTTRQMIKKGNSLIDSKLVEVEFCSEISDDLYEVYQATGKRGGFVIYSKKYLQDEFESFYNSDNACLYKINYDGKIISWGMVIFAGKRAFYHQGANIIHKSIPGSYICQWTGIQLAIQKGCTTYDFWGVSPLNSPDHPWSRISLFKRGFGGSDVELLHAQDLVLGWQYWLNWSIEKIRAKKRGFA
ncbi:MAG: peptidoglycan bridge formation glycyltransferase FemA/FemB family protein [Patescibacteria group bacterium]